MADLPSVCAVMLTKDRPEMARRAVECFRAQSYQNRGLFWIDTSETASTIPAWGASTRFAPELRGKTIGQLRNAANAGALHRYLNAEIIIHWDDDDYSHPERIAEQVKLLQSSGADAVGYREMLFWDERRAVHVNEPTIDADHWRTENGQACLYSSADTTYCLGTSLCYWRRVWERKPFEATSQGEDARWCHGLRTVGVRSHAGIDFQRSGFAYSATDESPRMIARIHAGNTSNAYRMDHVREEWKRAPEWDTYCRQMMAL